MIAAPKEPKVTEVAPLKLVPVIVTLVLPEVEPLDGDIEVIVGIKDVGATTDVKYG